MTAEDRSLPEEFPSGGVPPAPDPSRRAPARKPADPMRPERAVRLGWVQITFLALAVVYSLGQVAVAILGAQLEWALANPGIVAPIYAAHGAVALAMLAFAVGTLTRTRDLQRGTPGRGRVYLASAAAIGLGITYAGALAIAMWAAFYRAAETALPPESHMDLVLGLPRYVDILFFTLTSLAGACWLVLLGGLLASWFLIPARVRRGAWLVIDVLIAVAFVLSVWFFRFKPMSDAPEALVGPVIALTTTVLFSLRALAWLLPPIMNATEGLGFQALVAARHLRSKKSSFLATISVLAIGAVMVSSCALTTTLSVMGGFRNDLKRKILGNNAHVVVDKEHDTFSDWQPTLDATRNAEGVVAAAPYVSGEVMVTSASNLAGAVIRGVDPEAVDEVVELRDNMIRGKIEYLEEPASLLDLPADETGGPIPLETPRRIRSDDPPTRTAGEQGSPVRDIDEMLGDPMRPTPPAPTDDTEEIDEFLKGPAPAQRSRSVLPGLIVGRELARSLRLYVGDEVNVVSPLGDLGPAGPMPKSRPFRIAGIFYSGMYEYDMKYMYATLPVAQRFLNVGDDISGIEVKVENVDAAPVAAGAIRSAIDREDLRVRDWQETNRNLFGALELEKLAMFIALGIAILVAGFCVFGTLTLMVQEKNREVGVLKALGTQRRAIVGVFMIEGLMIGFFGALLGLGLGYVACFAAEHFGIRMNPEVYYIDRLPVHTDPTEFVLVGVSSVVVCLIATIFPAFLASDVRPVDALRYD